MATGSLALLTGYKSGRANRSEERLFQCRGCPRRFKANLGRAYHEKFCIKNFQVNDNARDSVNGLESMWDDLLEEKGQEVKGNFEYDRVQSGARPPTCK